jgi:AGZA family xanthine/uracil permease-like MFS transporter
MPVMLAAIPVVAISPILLYIGMLIGSQAFQETPSRHAPAVVLSLAPHLANWGHTLIGGVLAAVGVFEVTPELIAKMGTKGVMYEGLAVMGGGSILGGLVLGAIAVFIIDRKFLKASGFAAAGALLTFFGFMHGEKIGLGLGQTRVVAASYIAVALITFACAYFTQPATEVAEDEHVRPTADTGDLVVAGE